jgi:hypothetical protein
MYDYLQTFYISSDSVDNASEVLATSVYLYFKRKPFKRKNRSGIDAPGAVVQLIECDGEDPNTSKPLGQPVRVEFDDVYSLRDASSPTIFAFKSPIALETGKFYGIAIQLDDKDFRLWLNQQGRRVIGTNNQSSGKSRFRDGCLYRAVPRYFEHYWKQIIDNVRNDTADYIRGIESATAQYKSVKNKDLKFTVNIAKYNTNPDGTGGTTGSSGGIGNTTPASTITLVNEDYEFFTINAISGVFRGGETLFANNALSTGTVVVQGGNVVIQGSGTTFTSLVAGDPIVLTSGDTNFVGTINTVSNNTILTLQRAPTFTNAASTFRTGICADVVKVDYAKQTIVLNKSSAKAASPFAAGHEIRGSLSNAYATVVSVDNLSVDELIPHVRLGAAISANADVTFDIAVANGANFALEGSYEPITDSQQLNLAQKGFILSRSNEVNQSNLYGTNRKSGVIKIAVASSNSAHSAPHINPDDTDIAVGGYLISNTYLTQAANGSFYDSETDNHGAALSKYITKRFEFGPDQMAEDLRAFVVAHKPAGTELRVYAKLHNSGADNDTFDDKKWTLLECVDNANAFSSTTDLNDIIEYEYGIPAAPESELTASGTFTTSSGNSVVVGTTSNVNTAISVGRLVKVYSPYFADNYLIGQVVAANTTSFTLDTPVTDSNVLGSGFLVDLLAYTNSAFNNKQNDNIVRYYNSTGVTVDKYDSMQIKIVQLADASNIIPRIYQVQGIGVSA